MFQPGDLLWLPQKTVLIVQGLNAPQMIKIIEKPEVGLFMKNSDDDRDFCVVVCDGQEWITNKRHVKLLRRDNVSKIS